MEKREYLTIRELSLILGISRQSVYKHLDKKLTGFTTKLNGKDKVVKIEALKDVYGLNIEESCRKLDDIIKSKSKEKSTNRVNVDSKPDSKLVNQSVKVDSKPVNQEKELILSYKARIEQLEQDKKQLQEDKRLLNENLQTAHELLSQEQKLHLATQTRLLALEHKMEEEAPEPTPDATDQTHEAPSDSKKWWQFWK